jgi:hypothetical protein
MTTVQHASIWGQKGGTPSTMQPQHVGYIGINGGYSNNGQYRGQVEANPGFDTNTSGKGNIGGRAAQAQSPHQGKGIGEHAAGNPMNLYEAWNYAEEEQARAQNGSEIRAKGKAAIRARGEKAKAAKQGRAKGQAAHPPREWETGHARAAVSKTSAGGGSAGVAGNPTDRHSNR